MRHSRKNICTLLTFMEDDVVSCCSISSRLNAKTRARESALSYGDGKSVKTAVDLL